MDIKRPLCPTERFVFVSVTLEISVEKIFNVITLADVEHPIIDAIKSKLINDDDALS